MGDYLKSLSSDQIEHLIKEKIDSYLDQEFEYTVKDLNTPNADTKGDKISFTVEIYESETEYNH